MRRVIRGAWGPREESTEALAGRWKLTLNRLAELLPAAGSGSGAGDMWTWKHVRPSGPAADLRPDEDTLRSALQEAEAANDWSDRTGVGIPLVIAGEPGWKVSMSGRAGGLPEFLLQTMTIAVESPEGVDVPDVELLTLVAELWEPDFGDVSNDDVLDALEDDAGFAPDEPSVGWVGYLSPARAALLPDSFTATRKVLPGGGILLNIAAPGNTDDVLRANEQLREAGALQPLPHPMERATL
ncbi:hypothetical protein ACFVW8_17640 [Streptomyces sp. NPDC058221]|uniref:hypothetical protein n=1 Tax=Streptomyces sp. NPDC058221 TaxID=3346388 RepID=UPI0036E23546